MELNEIKKLTNESLLVNLSLLFEKERKISHVILLHLKVIQERRLFAERGYSTLFEMLVKEFKLSETSAHQRLKALEFIKSVPEAEKSFLTGEVNLTTLALAQRQIKQEEKATGEKLVHEKKAKIFEQIKNKTQNETEVELMRMLPNTNSNPKTHERRISDDACRISINMPDRLKEKLKRLQELWAHIDPSMEYIELIEKSVDHTLSYIDPLLKKARKTKHRSVAQEVEMNFANDPEPQADNRSKISSNTNTNKYENENTGDKNFNKASSTAPIPPEANKFSHVKKANNIPETNWPNDRIYLSVELRQTLWKNAGSRCEFVDSRTKRRCSSRFGLEVDHCLPLALGGSNDITNLRLLCRTHNLLMARRTFRSAQSHQSAFWSYSNH